MPSRARTQSPALTTRFYNWQTSINHHTSPALPGAGEVVSPLPRKGRQGAQPLHHTIKPSAKKSLERKPHPVPGEKDANSKMIANALGKKNCFNCAAADHWVVNCPNLTAAQCKILARMAHISISEDILEGIGFLQNKSTNAAVVATHKTLNPCCLYLDSTSSFHQVFTKEHLNYLNTAGITLRANCNAGTNFAT
jgi:hypothetical protein